LEFLANLLLTTTIILTQKNIGQSTFSAGICLCFFWQGYSGIWEGVTVSYSYKMEEQSHVILRKQMVSPCCSLTPTLQNGHKLCLG